MPAAGTPLEFRLLGPLEVLASGRPVELGPPKQRALLALLAARPNEAIPTSRLIDELWPGDPPRTAATALHGYVSALRKALGRERVETRAAAYLLRAVPGERDVDRFESAVASAREAPPADAGRLLRSALELWRGPPLVDVGDEPGVEAARRRLDEQRLAALEARIDADLACGKHAELVPELEGLVAGYPFRERLRARLMLALYGCGRQADALQAYADAREALQTELGLEPGPELHELQRRILTQHGSLLPRREPAPPPPPAASAPPPPAGAEQPTRRVVTVIFSDIVSSTALSERLDPEAFRNVMRTYFAAVSGALARHGGTVEKFIGDAVMAVFGVPRLREDDALRAVRAAVDMRAALADLSDDLRTRFGAGLSIRTGINTGEVIAGGSGDGETLATGDAVVLARRLEQAAGADEILLGEGTYELVRDAVLAEPTAALPLKGIERPVATWRVLDVLPDTLGVSRHFDAPLVDRERESALLAEALERAVAERSCQLVTLVGAAGIGKTRLALEFAFRAAVQARVLEGRCLDYGDGMTYWPVKEIVAQAAGLADADPDGVARGKIERLLPTGGQAALIAERVAAAIGLGDGAAGPEETFWGVRRLLEALAADGPLVVLLQDLHWAEPTLLDLVEYLANWSRGAPILLVCLARPELFELRPSWASGVPHAVTSTLGPLNDDESEQLMAHLLGEAPMAEPAARHVARAAEGNPLFVEEMLRMLVERGLLEQVGGDWRSTRDLSGVPMPATIQALLAARLDRLEDGERTVIQRAAVAGKVFWWGAMSDLVPASLRPRVGAILQTLVRKRLIEPEPMSFAGEDAFRFSHILVRDAAYAALPKGLRADLHERYAGWLERKAAGGGAGHDELVGYHLEQAYRYREELGAATSHDRELAARAGELLGTAGRRAYAREDMPAALSLLDRAVALVNDQHPARLELVRELSSALWAVGELARAETLLGGLVEAASLAGDKRIRWYALLEQASRRLLREQATPAELLSTAEQAIAVFEQLGDDVGLARAWRRVAVAHENSCRYADGSDAAARGLMHARRALDRQEESRLVDRLCTSLLYGPAAVGDAVARCEAMLAEADGNVLTEANVAVALAGLHAMRGAFADARALYARALALYEELGLRLPAAGATQIGGELELLAGDAVAAERELRRGLEVLEPIGAVALQAALLAAALYEQGRFDEAARYVSGSSSGHQTRDAQIVAGGLRAKLDARAGRLADAESGARAAVALADETDALNVRAGARVDLAAVLHAARRSGDAAAAAREALELYERKGNATAAARAAALFAAPVA